MISIEKKFIKNKPFFYLTEQVKIVKKYKKIQTYIGKNIPKDISALYGRLAEKEEKLFETSIDNIYGRELAIDQEEIMEIEKFRIRWKYSLLRESGKKHEELWRKFAISFIFESNAIEGSKLSQEEVKSIVVKNYIKKKLDRKEVIEAENSIKAFEFIRSGNFKLNQRSIIKLHKLVTADLGIEPGYKRRKIVVNNRETTLPGDVRPSMARLLSWYLSQQKSRRHPLFLSADFHSQFESIHPFSDGNGRVGRLLFNWMLLKSSYGVMLFKNRNRRAYFEALNQADEGRRKKWHWQCASVYKRTINELTGNF